MGYDKLKKFKKDFKELVTVLDRWLSFLTKAHELDKKKLPEKLEENEEISKAIVEVDRMFDEDEREIYIVRRDKTMVFESKLASAIDEGLEKGLEKGIKENKIKTALKMLKKGWDIDDISDMTDLTEKEIKNIIEENKK